MVHNKDAYKTNFVIGFAVTAVISLFAGFIIGVSSAIIAGECKQLWDEMTGKGAPVFMELIATVAGAFAAVGISVLASRIYGNTLFLAT